MTTPSRSSLFRAAVVLAASSLLMLTAATSAGAAEGDADLPEVATNPNNGDVTFVWKRRDGSANGGKDIIQGRRRLANGTLGGVFDISAAGQNADVPQVVVDPNGKATFVWLRFDGSDTEGDTTCCWIVQGRARAPDGTLGAVFNLSTPGQNAGSAGPPRLAVAPDGTVTFVWQSGSTPPVIHARRRTSGGTLGSIFTVAPSPTGGGAYAFAPELAVAPDGAVTFAWGKAVGGPPTTFQGRRRLSDGTMGGVFDVSPAASFPGGLHVAVDSNGKATFIWHREVSGSQRVEGRARAADASISPVFDVSSSGGTSPQLSVAPDGKVTFIWSNQSGSTNIILGRARTAGGFMGGIFDVSTSADTSSGPSHSNPQVAVAPNDGKATFVWDNAGDGIGNTPVKGRARLGSSVSPIFDVSQTSGAHFASQLAVAPDGKVTFVFKTAINGAGSQIQGRARLSDGTMGGIFDISQLPPSGST